MLLFLARGGPFAWDRYDWSQFGVLYFGLALFGGAVWKCVHDERRHWLARRGEVEPA